MKRPQRKEDGTYHINGKKFRELFGSRQQVMNGTAYKTAGELVKSDLMMNKWGRIVSRKKHATAKKEKRLLKSGYTAKKGKFGYVKVGTKKNRKTRKMRGGDPCDEENIKSLKKNLADAEAKVANLAADTTLEVKNEANAAVTAAKTAAKTALDACPKSEMMNTNDIQNQENQNQEIQNTENQNPENQNTENQNNMDMKTDVVENQNTVDENTPIGVTTYNEEDSRGGKKNSRNKKRRGGSNKLSSHPM